MGRTEVMSLLLEQDIIDIRGCEEFEAEENRILNHESHAKTRGQTGEKLMNIVLKPEQKQFIEAQIASGKYSSVEDVLAEAFRLLEAQEKRYQNWIEETRPQIAVGLEQADRGQLIEGKLAMERLRSNARQIRESRA